MSTPSKPQTAHPFARSFRDLVVYQKARELQRRIFEESRKFPKEEAYSLTDQIRRASRSVGAQIAEAWAKRDFEKHFLSKLTDADGEQMESQDWIICAVDCGYWDREMAMGLFSLTVEIGRMIGSMKERSAEFCPKDAGILREVSGDFFAPVASTPFDD